MSTSQIGKEPRLLFKISSEREWSEATRLGSYSGSPDDARDGFIHFSAADQVAGTAAKHFGGRSDLVLVAVDASRLGQHLKWEPSRGGALFPHLYAALEIGAVAWVRPLLLGSDGVHILPSEVAAC